VPHLQCVVLPHLYYPAKLDPKLDVKSRCYARLDVQLGIFGSQLDLQLAKLRSKLELELEHKLGPKSNI
jgi:hypothetical protein